LLSPPLPSAPLFPYTTLFRSLFFGSARIGGTFQRDHLPRPQIRFERIRGVDHEAHVRLAIFVQGCRNAENHRITLADAAEIGRCFEPAFSCGRYLFGRNMLDIAFSRIQLAYLALVNINPQNAKADGVIAKHQRKSYVSQAYDANQRFLLLELL